MADALLEKAKADLAEVSAQLAALRDKERKLRAFIQIYDADTLPLPLSHAEGKTQKERITNTVAAILADGRPRHTRDLLALLEADGLRIGAADKVIGLSTLLSRDSRFIASRVRGWSLASG